MTFPTHLDEVLAERDALRTELDAQVAARCEVIRQHTHARFMAAGWKRLAKLATRAVMPAVDAHVASYRAQLDTAARHLARAAAVVEAVKGLDFTHTESCSLKMTYRKQANSGKPWPCTCGMQALNDALAKYEEG